MKNYNLKYAEKSTILHLLVTMWNLFFILFVFVLVFTEKWNIPLYNQYYLCIWCNNNTEDQSITAMLLHDVNNDHMFLPPPILEVDNWCKIHSIIMNVCCTGSLLKLASIYKEQCLTMSSDLTSSGNRLRIFLCTYLQFFNCPCSFALSVLHVKLVLYGYIMFFHGISKPRKLLWVCMMC